MLRLKLRQKVLNVLTPEKRSEAIAHRFALVIVLASDSIASHRLYCHLGFVLRSGNRSDVGIFREIGFHHSRNMVI